MKKKNLVVGIFLLATLSVSLLFSAPAKAQESVEVAFEVQKMTDSATIKDLKDRVKSRVKDPFSVQFRWLVSIEDSISFMRCGQFNAKNSFGGYTGWTHFIYFKSSPAEPAEFHIGGLSDVMCTVILNELGPTTW